jgi:hypothetical protein
MRSFHRCETVAIVAVAIWSLPASVFAAPLQPGGTLFPAPSEPDPSGGSIVATAAAVPLVAATFTGNLTTTVIAGDTSNPYGGLTFTYLLTNDADSTNVISQLAVSGFAGFLADVSYQTPATGTLPALIDRSSTGSAVFFSFLDGIGPGALKPGSISALLVVQTNATNHRSMPASAIDGSIGMAASFTPAVAADFNHDGPVDENDFEIFSACATGPGLPYDPANLPPDCTLTPDAQGRIAADFDRDLDVDQSDFASFQRCLSGEDGPADAACAS